MTSKFLSQLDRKNVKMKLYLMKKINWLGTLALLGTLLLFVGVSMSSAKVSDKLLPNILKHLKDQGKRIKSTTVLEISDGKAVVTVTLANGEVRKYDSHGRLKEVKTAKGKVTIYKDGLPVEVRSPSGEVISRTRYFRSRDGRLRKLVKTGRNGTHTKHFDANGNVVQSTSPQGTKFYSNYIKNEKGKTVSYMEREMNTGKTNKVILDPKTSVVVAKIDQNGVRTDIEIVRDENGEMIGTIEQDSKGNRKEKKYKNGQLVEVIENGIRTVHENILNDKGVLVMKKERKFVPSTHGVVEDIIIKEFDESGRVIKKTDKDGEHTYKYILNRDGRIKARIEDIKTLDGSASKRKITHYDDFGRIIGIEEEGKKVDITYIVDGKGTILSSIEKVMVNLRSQKFKQVIRKEYDKEGHVIAKIDGNGLRTQFTYDAKGNKIASKNEFEESKYIYDDSGNLLLTVTKDHKSTNYIWPDLKSKLPKKKVRVKNNGVVEVTTYDTNEDGRRVSITQEAFGIRTTIYCGGGSEQPLQVIYVKNNGKRTVTDYEYFGDHVVASKEVGPGTLSETRYNGLGKPAETVTTDKWGRVTTTIYKYANGRMASSVSIDKKGKSITEYSKYEDPETITRINTIGFPRRSVEKRIYKDGILIESISQDIKGKTITFYDENEQPKVVHRINLHGFPRENRVTNIYNSSGELTESYQIDSRGFTANTFDEDGLMTVSVRKDIYGFPKEKTTTYQYHNGELITSEVEDERGHTYNEFDVDGLMRKSTRKKLYGFPREEVSTYEYDSNGYMIYSETTDENGYTQNWYNIDELVTVSFRENKYGHARQQWTLNGYDGAGFLTVSKETDLKGTTITQFNRDSLAISSMRYDEYGVIYSRDTLTFNEYDNKGFLTRATSKNIMTNIERQFDRDSLCQHQLQHDNYGILNSREKETTDYVYDDHGRLQTNIATDIMGTTYSKFDIHGDAVWTRRFANFGAELGRVTTTQSSYDADTGMILWSFAANGLNEVLTIHSSDTYALPVKSYAKAFRGAEMSRETETTITANIYHGLTEMTYAKNDLSEVTTWHSQDEYGLPERSFTRNYKGAELGRDTWTWIQSNKYDGITDKSLSKNGLNWTITIHAQDEWRLPVESFTHNYRGAEFGRDTWTLIKSNHEDGMTDETFAMNKLNWTKTVHAQDEWRLPKQSESWSFRGALLGRHTKTDISSNKKDGMTDETFSTNGLSEIRTVHAQDEWRLPKMSWTLNYRGAEMGRETTTEITSNHLDGMTDKTVAVNELNKTTTWHAQDQWRLPWLSKTENNFGAEFSRNTVTLIESDHEDGLTNQTFAMNKLNWTKTVYSQDEWRMPAASENWSFRGALLSRYTQTQIACSHEDGMTDITVSENGLSKTTTWHAQDEWRLPWKSRSINKYGAELGRDTLSYITSNKLDGMKIC